MNRRLALKQIVMATAAAAILPSCVFEKKKEETSLPLKKLQITRDHETQVAEITETIIPATDIPGAKALGVPAFVLKMVDDCYDKKSQDTFVKGLDQLNELTDKQYGNPFVKCSSKEKEEILTNIADKKGTYPTEVVEFIPMIKGLTIHGFLSSQKIMEMQGYEYLPGRFHGCVNVKDKKAA